MNWSSLFSWLPPSSDGTPDPTTSSSYEAPSSIVKLAPLTMPAPTESDAAAAQKHAQEQVAEHDRIMEKVRAAKPSWQTDGMGLRGDAPLNNFASRAPVDYGGGGPQVSEESKRSIPRPAFPVLTPQVPTQVAPDAASTVSLAFLLTPATDPATGALSVTVTDGLINDVYPSGMGYGGYTLAVVEEPYQQVYAVVLYDEDTLEITSRTLGISDSPPTSESGSLVIPIGYLTVTYDGGGKPILTATNQTVGNIKFQFIYGSYNAAPALFPVLVAANPIVLPTT